MASERENVELAALEYHKATDGEYGCPGVECPGVKRLADFWEPRIVAAKEEVYALVRQVPSPLRANHGKHWTVESDWECDWCGASWSVTKGLKVEHPQSLTCLWFKAQAR